MGGMRRGGALALAVALSVSVVACGGDSEDDASKKTTASAAVDANVDLDDFKGECAAFVGAFAGASAAIGSVFSGSPNADLEAAADYFTEVADKLPKEIRADFAIFAEAYTKFAKAVAEADIDFGNPSSMDPDTMSKLAGLSEAFSDPKVAKASENVNAYMQANCGQG